MRWTFWRGPSTDASTEPVRALPDDVGLAARPHPPAASARDDEQDDADRTAPAGGVSRTSGAAPTDGPSPTYDAPPSTPAPGLDRSALAAAGPEVAQHVRAVHTGTPPDPSSTDVPVLAAAATGVLAARLPALSGVSGAVVFDEPEDELLHAYADLLVTRAAVRRTAISVDRDDLLAVAHLAAAAAAVDAADEPALLLLAGVPAEAQLGAAALLLAQTADDGGGAPDRLAVEVRELFAPQG